MEENCILCGAQLELKLEGVFHHIGYKCAHCQIEWTLAEHKNPMNWAVRHIRALETQLEEKTQQIADLTQRISALENI